MKKILTLLCLLIFVSGTAPAQLVKERDIKRFIKQHRKEIPSSLKKRLPPVSFIFNNFDGEIKKYYPTDVYNRDNMMRDTLFYNEKAVLIYQSPLLDFPGIKDSLIRKHESKMPVAITQNIGSITCKREFTAQWFIRGDSLYVGTISQQGILIEFDPEYEASLPPEQRQVFISHNKLKNRLEQVTGIPYNSEGLMFAGWVTGKIAGGVNGLYLYEEHKKIRKPYNIEYTGHYIYPEEYWFEVENGIIKKVEIKTL